MLYIIWQCYILHNNNVEKKHEIHRKINLYSFSIGSSFKKIETIDKKQISYLIKKVWTIYKAMLSYYFNYRKTAGKTKNSKNW